MIRSKKKEIKIFQDQEPKQHVLFILVIGASGDVAKKKIYPALLELYTHRHQVLHQQQDRQHGNNEIEIVIYGFARSVMTDHQFRNQLRPFLVDNPKCNNKSVNEFLSICRYHYGSGYNDESSMIELLYPFATNIHNILIYLAIPPNIFSIATLTIRNTLRHINTIPFHIVRIILEKPFGHDTLSCQLLLQSLQQQQWDESNLYRIDHYLGKHAVRKIITIRQYLAREKQHLSFPWNNLNRTTVQSVHIILKETFGIEQRGGYYDTYGVIRDVIQNHLLQILTLLIMKIPFQTTAESIRDSKVHVLQSLETVQVHDCLFGQYDGYLNDPSIQDKNSKTPTYACIRLLVNHQLPDWMGVPLYLEAGKALDDGVCEIRINMRQNSTSVVLQIQPLTSISLIYNNTRIPIPNLTKDCQTRLSLANDMFLTVDQTSSLGAYTTLILDALHGQSSNFVRNDELLEAWRIFTAILHEYERNNTIQPISYPCGSSGPMGRLEFLQQLHVANKSATLRSSL